MTREKKLLLDDNKDLVISEADMALDVDALKGIISAKRDYQEAEKNKDYVSMTKANQKAEGIRRNFGYTGGESGAGYYKVAKPEKYVSKYQTEIDSLYDKVMDTKPFTYDAEEDPIYQVYKKIYVKAGEDAYDRALAQNSIRTGGLASSSAISAASQAQAYYNNKLSDMIPELYDMAYNKYQNDIKQDYDRITMLKNADKTDYERYLKSLDDYYNERDYYDNLDNIELERAYSKMRDEEKDRQWQMDYDFGVSRALAEDKQWQTEFDYMRERDNLEDAYQKSRDAIEDAQWQKSYNLSASKKSSSSTSSAATKEAQWEKEYKLDAIKTIADVANTIYETGMDFDTDILTDMLKDLTK